MSRKRHKKVHHHTPPEKAAKIQRKGTLFAAAVGLAGVLAGAVIGFFAQDALKESHNISARSSRFNAAIANIGSPREAMAQDQGARIKSIGSFYSLQELVKSDLDTYGEPTVRVLEYYINNHSIFLPMADPALQPSSSVRTLFDFEESITPDSQTALSVIVHTQGFLVNQGKNPLPLKIEHRYLKQVNLEEAKLSGSSFNYSYFIDARMRLVDLAGAHLVGTVWSRAHSQEANFSGADLTNSVWDGAHLQKADFSNADLTNSVWDEARLFDANFSGANLEGADLRAAILVGANFGGANLSKAMILPSQLGSIKSDKKTVWPQGIAPSEEGQEIKKLVDLIERKKNSN